MRHNFLLVAACMLAFSCSANASDDSSLMKSDCYKNNIGYFGSAGALRVCMDGKTAVGILSETSMKGLPPLRKFMDKKFQQVLGAAHQAYGSLIYQEYDTDYYPSPTEQSFIYSVSRRVSWWVYDQDKKPIRSSFYVILRVDIVKRKAEIMEYRTQVD
jgi:hypothetical protein